MVLPPGAGTPPPDDPTLSIQRLQPRWPLPAPPWTGFPPPQVQPRSDAARVVGGFALLAVPVAALVVAYVLPTIRTFEFSRLGGLGFGDPGDVGGANYDRVVDEGAFWNGMAHLIGPTALLVLGGAVVAPLLALLVHRAGAKVRAVSRVAWALAAVTFAPAALTVAWLVAGVVDGRGSDATVYDWPLLVSGVVVGTGVLAGLAALRGDGKHAGAVLTTAGLTAIGLTAAGLQTFAYGTISGLPADAPMPLRQIYDGVRAGLDVGGATAKSMLLLAVLAVLGVGAAVLFVAARVRIDVLPRAVASDADAAGTAVPGSTGQRPGTLGVPGPGAPGSLPGSEATGSRPGVPGAGPGFGPSGPVVPGSTAFRSAAPESAVSGAAVPRQGGPGSAPSGAAVPRQFGQGAVEPGFAVPRQGAPGDTGQFGSDPGTPVGAGPDKPTGGAVVVALLVLVVALGAVGYYLAPWASRIAEGGSEAQDLWFVIRRTWGPPLVTTGIALVAAAVGGFAIGALRPLGDASRWLLLPFAPWLLVGTGPLAAANLEAVAGEGEWVAIGSFPPRAWIAIPLLFLFTALCWGLEDRRRALIAQGHARGTANGAFVKAALPFALLAGLVLLLVHVQDLFWTQLTFQDMLSSGVMTYALANLDLEHTGITYGFPLPLLAAYAVAAVAFALWYLPRLAIRTGRG
ncbi:hypothetical protein [Glycomyces sp. NPDC047010]|uniref:hypothetical protein n=1 Tax=Glycomyces sp. NPDC047010 TaxID=3155023 RepID=UPI0033C9AE0A